MHALRLALIVLFLAPSAFAAKPSLNRYAGSYTGTAFSSTSAGEVSGNATLTFTGYEGILRGTFLYTGILNNAGAPKSVIQTVNIARSGACSGRVILDGANGQCTGQASMRGRKLSFTLTYQLPDTQNTTITLAGSVLFQGRRAHMTATVTSSDPGYIGTLVVKGRR